MTSLQDIQWMTLWEFNIRMKAHNLQMVDDEFQMHYSAWVNREVNAQRKSGKKLKYVYTNFKDFYDYEGELAKITGEKKKKPETMVDRLREYERRKKDGGEL